MSIRNLYDVTWSNWNTLTIGQHNYLWILVKFLLVFETAYWSLENNVWGTDNKFLSPEAFKLESSMNGYGPRTQDMRSIYHKLPSIPSIHIINLRLLFRQRWQGQDVIATIAIINEEDKLRIR